MDESRFVPHKWKKQTKSQNVKRTMNNAKWRYEEGNEPNKRTNIWNKVLMEGKCCKHLFCFGKNNRSECVNFVFLTININWGFSVTLEEQRELAVSLRAMLKSTAWVSHIKIYSTPLTFCLLFSASLDFPKATSWDFSVRGQHQVAFLLN